MTFMQEEKSRSTNFRFDAEEEASAVAKAHSPLLLG
ncbi:hypothetical protein ABIE78_005406 [Sinorhizobium fredii]|jgi:hypothetical protein